MASQARARITPRGPVRDAHFGAITFVQRSDASLRLNPHFHTLALDGVYSRDRAGALTFHALSEPTAQHVMEVAAATHRRLVRVLERHGRSLEGIDDAQDSLALEQAVLASCYAASAGDLQLLGAEPGERTRKLARPVRLRETTPSEALAEVGGVNVHAKVVIDGRDRPRLERLCRYIARPPLAQDRLELHHDGRLRYTFKRAWKDGTHAVLLDPLDLIARLCTLVPPPRVHMLRYHGVLAANANMARRSEATSTCAWQAQQTGGENPRPGALMQGTRHRRGKGVDLEHQVPGSGEAARQAPVGPVRGGPVDP